MEELARASDLSPSFIFQLETGKTDISLGRLIRVAEALRIELAELLQLGARGPVVRADARVEMPSAADGAHVWLLAPSLDNKRVFALLTLEEDASITQQSQNVGSEYFIYVVEGSVSIRDAAGSELLLSAGDSTSQRSDDFRSMANRHRGQSVSLWAQSERLSTFTDPESAKPRTRR